MFCVTLRAVPQSTSSICHCPEGPLPPPLLHFGVFIIRGFFPALNNFDVHVSGKGLWTFRWHPANCIFVVIPLEKMTCQGDKVGHDSFLLYSLQFMFHSYPEDGRLLTLKCRSVSARLRDVTSQATVIIFMIGIIQNPENVEKKNILICVVTWSSHKTREIWK